MTNHSLEMPVFHRRLKVGWDYQFSLALKTKNWTLPRPGLQSSKMLAQQGSSHSHYGGGWGRTLTYSSVEDSLYLLEVHKTI